MPEVLVTGGRGALGSGVVDRLRAAGRRVRVLSRSGKPGIVRGDLSTGRVSTRPSGASTR